MKQFTRRLQLIALVTTLFVGLSLVGCASKATEEQMRQLNDLKAEVTSLEQQVASKEREKASLEKEVAEKNGKLQQCNADKEVVKGATK